MTEINTEDDFGFLTYDEKIDEPETVIQTVDTSSLESKIDAMAAQNVAIAAQLVDLMGVDMSTEDLESQRLQEAYDLMSPLLLGLIETSDKDWIHWPNRKIILETKLDELKRITGG